MYKPTSEQYLFRSLIHMSQTISVARRPFIRRRHDSNQSINSSTRFIASEWLLISLWTIFRNKAVLVDGQITVHFPLIVDSSQPALSIITSVVRWNHLARCQIKNGSGKWEDGRPMCIIYILFCLVGGLEENSIQSMHWLWADKCGIFYPLNQTLSTRAVSHSGLLAGDIPLIIEQCDI